MIKIMPLTLRRTPSIMLMVVLILLALVSGSVAASAAGGGGGTAKPPKGAVAPFVTPTLPDPVTSVNPALIHGFDDTGFIQNATVD
ncbi:MAG: hypothetical protein QOD31_2803, partial [Pseudonocardiales bacterium]|nr:hypothetical protein [Pseudonocardiales bacterium]